MHCPGCWPKLDDKILVSVHAVLVYLLSVCVNVHSTMFIRCRPYLAM